MLLLESRITSVHFFKDEVKTVWLFEVLDQLDDVLVTLAVVERLDLLEDAGPGKKTPHFNFLGRSGGQVVSRVGSWQRCHGFESCNHQKFPQ